MPTRKVLQPAFVMVVAAAAAACSGIEGLSSFSNPQPDPPEKEFDPRDSMNPPPPEPVPPPQPVFGTTIRQAVAPPSLGAATIVATADGKSVVATDPDRDRVVIVDLGARTARDVPLAKDDEPGRITLTEGKAHVVLRRAGAVATIDLAAGTVERREACAAPRGIAVRNGELLVTCSGGELVGLPVGGGAKTLLAHLDDDLRDIVVSPSGQVRVSRLRSAEVLALDAGWKVTSRTVPTASKGRDAGVAWRMIAAGEGVILVHQAAQQGELEVEVPQAYVSTDPCGGPVTTMIHAVATTLPTVLEGATIGDAVLPVDVARSPDGLHHAVIAAGNGHTPSLSQVMPLDFQPGSVPARPDCLTQPSSMFARSRATMKPESQDPRGQAVAATYTVDSAHLVVLTREPAGIHIRKHEAPAVWSTIPLGGESREDTGHAIFHSNSGGGISCASCHPEGGEDGRVWALSSGSRRTQTLRGILEGTAPYHWGGDAPGLETFASEVFTKKMGGPAIASEQLGALQSWLFALPAVASPPPRDPAASARGKALFESAGLACSTCHSGPKLTNNQTVDVGTGGPLQVPGLVGLAQHAPFMHEGCATTLADVARCGGSAHTTIATLEAARQADLLSYLGGL